MLNSFMFNIFVHMFCRKRERVIKSDKHFYTCIFSYLFLSKLVKYKYIPKVHWLQGATLTCYQSVGSSMNVVLNLLIFECPLPVGTWELVDLYQKLDENILLTAELTLTDKGSNDSTT